MVQISVTVPYLTENFDPTPLWWLRCRYLFHTLPKISPRHQQIQRHYGDSNFGVLRMPRVSRGKKSSALWRFRFRVSASPLANIPSTYWKIRRRYGGSDFGDRAIPYRRFRSDAAMVVQISVSVPHLTENFAPTPTNPTPLRGSKFRCSSHA